jgi:hypothetical protein
MESKKLKHDGDEEMRQAELVPFFDNVPDHLICDILEFIAAPEIGVSVDGLSAFVKFGMTCKRMRALVNGSAVWKRVDPGEIGFEMFLSAGCDADELARLDSFARLRQLSECETFTLRGGRFDGAAKRCVEGLADGCSRVKHFSVIGITVSLCALGTLLSIPPEELPHSLGFGDAGRLCDPDRLDTLELSATPCEEILSNRMRHRFERDPISRRLVLRVLRLDHDSQMARNIVAANPGITSLKLDQCGIPEMSYSALIKPLAALSELTCDNAMLKYLEGEDATADGVAPLVSIKKLKVRRSDNSILSHRCFSRFPNLETLDLSQTTISYDALVYIAMLQNLTDISVNLGAREQCLTLEQYDRARVALHGVGKSGGALFRRVWIRGGSLSPVPLLGGSRCAALETVEAIDIWSDPIDTARAIARPSLREVRMGFYDETEYLDAVSKNPRVYHMEYSASMLFLLDSCPKLRSVDFPADDLDLCDARVIFPDSPPRWFPPVNAFSLRKVRLLLGPWSAEHLPRLSRAFAYATELTLAGQAREFGNDIAKFVGACPNIVRVNVETAYPLRYWTREAFPKHVEIVQRESS